MGGATVRADQERVTLDFGVRGPGAEHAGQQQQSGARKVPGSVGAPFSAEVPERGTAARHDPEAYPG